LFFSIIKVSYCLKFNISVYFSKLTIRIINFHYKSRAKKIGKNRTRFGDGLRQLCNLKFGIPSTHSNYSHQPLKSKRSACYIYIKKYISNHLGGGPVVKTWDQEVCSLCDLIFKPCCCSYDGHLRLTWSLTSGPVGLVEVRASWPGYPR
jgi:hypothetical protein